MTRTATATPVLRVPTTTIYKGLLKWGQHAMSLPASKVRRAYQDNSPAPFPYPFCYFSIISVQRTSTNAETFSVSPLSGQGTGGHEAGMLMTVQLDIYGPEAMDLCQVAELNFRSPAGVEFFKDYKMAPCYTTPPVMLSGARDEKGNWGERATMRLIFSFTQKTTYSEGYFADPVLEVKNSEVIPDNSTIIEGD